MQVSPAGLRHGTPGDMPTGDVVREEPFAALWPDAQGRSASRIPVMPN